MLLVRPRKLNFQYVIREMFLQVHLLFAIWARKIRSFRSLGLSADVQRVGISIILTSSKDVADSTGPNVSALKVRSNFCSCFFNVSSACAVGPGIIVTLKSASFAGTRLRTICVANRVQRSLSTERTDRSILREVRTFRLTDPRQQ